MWFPTETLPAEATPVTLTLTNALTVMLPARSVTTLELVP